MYVSIAKALLIYCRHTVAACQYNTIRTEQNRTETEKKPLCPSLATSRAGAGHLQTPDRGGCDEAQRAPSGSE